MPQSLRHSRTGKLSQRIPSHPLRRPVLRFRQSPGHRHGGSIERAVAFADRAKCHVYRLVDEIASVAGFAFDKSEARNKLVVAGSLVVHGETPQQRKGRSFLKLVTLAAPLRDLCPCVWRAVEQVEAHRIAKFPVVEGLAPTVHPRAVSFAGSPTKDASMRASYTPVFHSAEASSWLCPSL